MAHEFVSGFFVREPAWHGLGTVLPDYLPLDTEEQIQAAMKLAGHDFTLDARPVFVRDSITQNLAAGWQAFVKRMPGNVSDGTILHIAKDSYQTVGNRECWGIMQALIGQGMKLETAVVLRRGAVCSLLAWLPEPIRIAGDDSDTLPFYNLKWAHDGSGAVSGRATSVRVVCMNTLSAAEIEGRSRGTEFDFTIRHTKNAVARVEDAKLALHGLRAAHAEYVELANELAEQAITDSQLDLFIRQFIPSPDASVEISDRVREHIEDARGAVRGLFDDANPTIPPAHKRTAYGLMLAGVEYLDHIRAYRSDESRFGRSLLREEPAKAKLRTLIKEVVAA